MLRNCICRHTDPLWVKAMNESFSRNTKSMVFEQANIDTVHTIKKKLFPYCSDPLHLGEPWSHVLPDGIWFGPKHTWIWESKNLVPYHGYSTLGRAFIDGILAKSWNLPAYEVRGSSRDTHLELKITSQVYSPMKVLAITTPSVVAPSQLERLSDFKMVSPNHAWLPNLSNDPDPNCMAKARELLYDGWEQLLKEYET